MLQSVANDQEKTLLEETGAETGAHPYDLDDMLSETTENLDEVNLPEDPFFFVLSLCHEWLHIWVFIISAYECNKSGAIPHPSLAGKF